MSTNGMMAVTKGTRKQRVPPGLRGVETLRPGPVCSPQPPGSAVSLMRQNMTGSWRVVLSSSHSLHSGTESWGRPAGPDPGAVSATLGCALLPALPWRRVWCPFGAADPFRKGSHLQAPGASTGLLWCPRMILLGCRLPLVGVGEEV